jgi:3-hydroxyisobutyrate dehydrogenase-like beta-hydroxyacid dehydrogenase
MDDVIGFVGLGNMGGNMAANLARAGHRLRVFDISPQAIATLTALPGVEAVHSAGEVAAGADVLFTVLPNDDIVRRTYLDPGGIGERGRSGLVTCDCSTVSPEVTQAVQPALAARGIVHMDTPMLGSKPQAVSGEIFFIVAGDEAQMPRIAPLLEVLGRLHMYVGPSSTANRIKLIHNVLGAANSVAAAESLALCVQAGVDPEVYRQVVVEGSGMAYTTYFGRRVERVLNGDYSTQFSLELMHKDVNLALAIARRSHTPTPIFDATQQAYSEGLAGGWRKDDFSAVTHVIEGKIGRKIGRK